MPLTPAQILGLGTKPGQAHFNVGIGRPTGHTDYTLQQLEAGYQSDPEFVALPSGAVRMRVRCDAQKTSSKTKYARVELRETDAAGKLLSWDGRKGTHWCEWVSRVTHLPKVKPWCVVGQIHDASSDLVRVQTEGTAVDKLKLVSRNTPPGSTTEQTVTVDPTYQLGDLVVGRLEVIDGKGREYLDGKLVREFPANTDGCYFKVGAYVQSTEAGEYAEVELLGVRHWHSGWPSVVVPATPATPTPAPAPGPAGTQTLGVGGVAAPAGAILATADSTAPLTITKPGVYDGQGHKVGRVTVNASGVTVQNYRIVAGSQYGAVLDGDDITFQNNDITGVKPSGDGDLNAITAFGDRIKIRYNTAINFVSGDPGDSHTDFIQTWVSGSHPKAGKGWEIVGNKATGPANPKRDPKVPSIHQWLMVEGAGQGGNSGGSGKPSGWLIADNVIGDSWNQAIKLDGVTEFTITRNQFVGSSDHVIEVTDASSGVRFMADNQITGQYGSIGVPVTPSTPVPGTPAPAPAPSTPPPPSAPDVIVLIRHAEKPDGKLAGVNEAGKADSHSLTTTGWARAGALCALVRFGVLPRPDRIYASKAKAPSMRPLQTILFLARLLKLTPITKFDVEVSVPATAAELNAQHGVTWISMEHSAIVALLTALGVKVLKSWPDARFDVALVLVRTGAGWTLQQVPQQLLPGDLVTAI